ncbi:MAG: EFR1 family ferrodoxin [Spirochaetaceae bacterium]|jgi:ferredoxin|nr:EFR1 family ferrodoxin [Spirochaetaceae bacterium]
MILCFSGTGNSLYTAKFIAKIIDDKIVSINELIRNNSNEKMLSDKPFVFVCPTYAWRIPDIVEKYIKKTIFVGNNKAYFILTCGGETGNAIHYIKKTCLEKRLEFMGFSSVIMPENYILMFNVPDKIKAKEIIQESAPHMRNIAENIKEGKIISQPKTKFSDKLKSGVINRMFYKFMINAKGFYSTNDCIGCEKCIVLCPLKNIEVKNKKAFWESTCTHCMSCICGCPQSAIEFKNKTKGRSRNYYIGDQIQ